MLIAPCRPRPEAAHAAQQGVGKWLKPRVRRPDGAEGTRMYRRAAGGHGGFWGGQISMTGTRTFDPKAPFRGLPLNVRYHGLRRPVRQVGFDLFRLVDGHSSRLAGTGGATGEVSY